MRSVLDKVESRFKINLFSTVKYLILALYGISTLFPLVWCLVNSFKDNDDIFTHPLSLPSILKFDNYANVWTSSKLGLNFLNSLIVAVFSIIFTVAICAMAAFILARFEFKLKFAIYSFLLLGLMVPSASVLLPLFILYNKVGILNHLTSLVVAYTAFQISITVLILTGFMKSIPKELEESAIIDGASGVRVFIEIIIPLSRAALVTVIILAFMHAWNEYLFALVFISSPELKTLTLGLAGFKTEHIVYYGQMSAGIMISVIPVIIVYAFLQDKVIKGMTVGAIKG